MILRGLFAASLSILLSGATLTGVARAFAWPKPPPPPFRTHDPAEPGPLILTSYAIADRPARPCPPEGGVDWNATLLSASRPRIHDLGAARFSPGYCVQIGTNGRVRALYLADGSGDPALDRALAATIRQARFVAAQRNWRSVTIWHRIVFRLPDRPSAFTTARRPHPELVLSGNVR